MRTNEFEVAKEVAARVESVLTPAVVQARARDLAKEHPQIRRIELGVSANGHPIESYFFGDSKGQRPTTLWYGLPDPGEAVGATGIIALMEDLVRPGSKLPDVDVNWLFVPITNYDDQPENGTRHAKVMKTNKQEIDWCLGNPRPETSALVNVAKQYRPIFTFPMHDEWHCHEEIPLYFPVSRRLPVSICDDVRDLMRKFGFSIAEDPSHPEMGQGFFEISTAPDFDNSTFSVFATCGLVGICEVCDSKNVSPRDQVAAQVAFGLKFLDYSLSNTK